LNIEEQTASVAMTSYWRLKYDIVITKDAADSTLSVKYYYHQNNFALIKPKINKIQSCSKCSKSLCRAVL